MKHPEVDVVIVGIGWAGGIIAAELAKAGLSVVGLERGPDLRDTDIYQRAHDELRFHIRNELVQNTADETWTFRHNLTETALPVRYVGFSRPGAQVGGSGLTSGGGAYRLSPHAFALRSETIERYGKQAIPEHSTMEDWPISYEELEPYYTRFEKMAGIAGKAGNLRGEIQEGGNPFEGSRSEEFPVAPHRDSATAGLFRKATAELGLHPYSKPSANLSEPYTNPDGISRDACVYGGFCHAYACQPGAKASPNVTVLPVAERTGNFELRAQANVFDIVHEAGHARSVRYYDAEGVEHEQPAAVIVVAAFTFNNARLLLLSGLGTPYDPKTGTGSVGKNFCNQLHGDGTGFFADRSFKRYMGASGPGTAVSDFSDDNFDHTGLDFIGGGMLSGSSAGAAPIKSINLPHGTPAFGAARKDAMRKWYDRSMRVSVSGESLSHRGNYFDLDPTYRDAWGLPLLRMTFNWHENDRRSVRYLHDKVEAVFKTMGADSYHIACEIEEYYSTDRYQGTHPTGGAIMGDDPSRSVVNRSLQMWDCENVFVVGGSAMPQNFSQGPTGTIGALAYLAAESIIDRYARRQELLA